jgi:hypothetical protein
VKYVDPIEGSNKHRLLVWAFGSEKAAEYETLAGGRIVLTEAAEKLLKERSPEWDTALHLYGLAMYEAGRDETLHEV